MELLEAHLQRSHSKVQECHRETMHPHLNHQTFDRMACGNDLLFLFDLQKKESDFIIRI